MANYLQSSLNSACATNVSGDYTDPNFLIVANNAVREVIAETDLRSLIRKSALSPNLFDEIYQYTCPSDMKGDKIIDAPPQIGRGKDDRWTLTTPEEFDRRKHDGSGDNLIAIDRDDMVNKLLVSMEIDDDQIVISNFDSVGDWVLFADGTNLTADSDNYVKGSASLNWDISAAGGTTAGVYNPSLTTFDVSDYKGTGSIFVWAYITSATNLTNYIIRVGSSSSAYYAITATTTNEGTSFEAGWNLIRFDFVNKSTTGTPDDDACVYVALYMTKAAGKISETDYRFDNLVMKKGKNYYVKYYSRYGWQSNTGTWLENATATTDYLNVESDEYNLIFLKTCEKLEEHLKNFSQADRLRKQYQEARVRYVFDNPSQSLLLSQQYYQI